MRIRIPLMAAAGIATAVATACTPAPPASSSKPAATSAPTTAAAAQPAATQSGAAAAAGSGGVIRIGLLEPLTGTLAQQGKSNEDGFNLYLQSINSTIAGHKIEVVVGDTAGNADTGLAKAKQLVENNKVDMLAGITATPVCYAVAGYVKQAKVPLIVSGNCGAEDLTYNDKFASPYLVRLSQIGTSMTDPLADYVYSQGTRKISMIASDYAGGVQTAAGFESTFVNHGGTVVQEQFPKLGTNDFGPFLAQVNPSAQALIEFTPGADALRLAQQFQQYVGQKKLPLYDLFGLITNGSTMASVGDNSVGVISDSVYSSAYDSPENKAFISAYEKKFPSDPFPSYDAAQGYAGAQVLEAAIKAVNGNVTDKQAFLNALYKTDVQTAKGPVKLDERHDIIGNIYVYTIVKNGNKYEQKLLKTYSNVGLTWDRTLNQIKTFPWDSAKGKFVNIDKAKLQQILKQ